MDQISKKMRHVLPMEKPRSSAEKDNDKDKFINVRISDVFKFEGQPVGKPCICTAEDLAQAANATEVEKMASPETAIAILSIMLDFESKLNHIFSGKKVYSGSMSRRISVSEPPPEPPPTSCLKQLPKTDFVPQSFSLDSDFQDLIGINLAERPCSIAQFKLVHPLQSYVDFNGAVSQVVHLSHSLQKALNIKHKCILIPIPNAALIQVAGVKKRLWFSQANAQTGELQELSSTMGVFLAYLDDICLKAAMTLNIEVPQKTTDTTIAQLVSSASVKVVEDVWFSAAVSLLTLAKFCARCIQIIADEGM